MTGGGEQKMDRINALVDEEAAMIYDHIINNLPPCHVCCHDYECMNGMCPEPEEKQE